MKKYDQYKNSGVEWLGEIPEHWELKRFKFITNIQKGKLPRKIVTTNEFNLPPYMSMEYLRGGEENQWVFDRDAKIIDENETLLLWDGSNAGEFIKSRKGVISSTVAEIEFKNIHNSFAWFYSKFLEIELRKKTIGMGIPHVNGTELKNFFVALPPTKEQILIANFLEDKTIKIDQAIAIKQKQIELLKERRQILIHKAVTRGLNDKVKLKDSGVEWIGEVPEHWEVLPLTKYSKRIDYRGKTPEKVEDGIFLITTKNIKEGRIDYENSKEYVLDKHYNSIMSRGIPEIGDILFTMEAPLGMSAVVDRIDVAIAQRIIKFNFCKIRFNSTFVNYSIQSEYFQKHLKKEATGSTAQGIKASKLHKLKIITPEIKEQKKIVEYIEIATTKITTAISLKEQEIEKLKEYKMSLIDGVVTGKVKVC